MDKLNPNTKMLIPCYPRCIHQFPLIYFPFCSPMPKESNKIQKIHSKVHQHMK